MIYIKHVCRQLGALLAITFTIALIFPGLALAASYYVTDVQAAGSPTELAGSVKALVTTAVSNAGGEIAGGEKEADFVLKPDIVKLGNSYVLTVTRSGKGGAFASRQKAASADELDNAADRAVRAAILSVKAKNDVRVGEVTERETKTVQRRIESHRSFYFGLGPAYLANMAENKLAYDITIARLWEVSPHAAIKISGALVGVDFLTYFTTLELGMNYYFTDEDSSPYLSAGLGLGGSASVVTRAQAAAGFAGSVGAGYQFFRTSSTQFDVFLGYSGIYAYNGIGAPGAYGLRIGILF